MRRSLLLGPALASAFVLLFAAAGPALGEKEKDDGPVYSRTGPYLGVGFAISQEQFPDITVNNPNGTVPPQVSYDPGYEFDPGLGYSVRAGFRINEFVAADVFLRQTFDNVTSDGPFRGPASVRRGVDDPDAELLTITPGLRVYPVGHLDWRFQPSLIAQVGYFRGKAPSLDVSDHGVAVRLGAGVEAYITRHIALVFDFTYNVGAANVSKLDHLGYDFGLIYRF